MISQTSWNKVFGFCFAKWQALIVGFLVTLSIMIALYCARNMTWEMFLELLKTFFDLLKGIAWPLGILTTALIFKSDVKKLFPRIRKFSAAGVELDPLEPLEQQQLPAPPPPSDMTSLEPPTIAVKDIENRIRTDLANRPPEIRDQLLIRRLAIVTSVAWFENIYGLIFGTQIQALERLFEVNSTSLAEANEYYNSVLEPLMETPSPISFEDWSAFLFARELVKMEDEKVTITEMGKEFVRWLHSQNRSTKRPF